MILLKNFLNLFCKKRWNEFLRGSEFVFDSVDLLYHTLHIISLNRGGSYIVSPEWLKTKKATVNPKNNDDKCFQYTLTVVRNHKQIKRHPERMSKIKRLIDQYNCFSTTKKTGKNLN